MFEGLSLTEDFYLLSLNFFRGVSNLEYFGLCLGFSVILYLTTYIRTWFSSSAQFHFFHVPSLFLAVNVYSIITSNLKQTFFTKWSFFTGGIKMKFSAIKGPVRARFRKILLKLNITNFDEIRMLIYRVNNSSK